VRDPRAAARGRVVRGALEVFDARVGGGHRGEGVE
jgi:hypothetical protein